MDVRTSGTLSLSTRMSWDPGNMETTYYYIHTSYMQTS